MKKFSLFLKDLFSCSSSICFARFWGSIGFVIYFLNSILAVNEPWEAIKFAEGCAIIIFSVYAALRTKGKEG